MSEMSEREKEIVEQVNSLSDGAVYMVSRDWFGQILAGKPILAAPQNAKQETIFDELLEIGYVHGDVERAVFGYRSTYEGRAAHPYCKVVVEESNRRAAKTAAS